MTSDQHPHHAPTGDRTAAEVAVEDQDLHDSLTALARMTTSQRPLTGTLTRLAELAVRAIPGADGAGLTLQESGQANTVVATTDLVAEIEEIQYRLGQGPCISAASDGVTIISGSLGADLRWRKFGSQVARLGMHSVISLPLITPEGVVGAMNVYAHAKHVFDERTAELGELFAIPAAISVQNAQVLAEAQRLVDRLQHALEEQGVVDRAVGILISRSGGTAEEALDRLRTLSQHEHQKMIVVAENIVEETARRARARLTDH